MNKTYYALKIEDGDYLALYYDGRYEITHVTKERFDIEVAGDIIFSKQEQAEYELKNIRESSCDYDLSELTQSDISSVKIVEIKVELNCEVVEKND